jgi:hypothetical protein
VSTAAGTVCPRCGNAVAAAQEYCLVCGLRLPGRFRLGPSPIETRNLRLRIAALAAVAIAGAGVAIAVVGADDGPEPIVTATGGSVTTPSPAAGLRARLATWPRTARGWTIVLVSVPKPKGRDEAVAVARQARTRGLRGVGVLDSSRFASLRPGYWMTFSGRYPSEAEATASLRRARVVVKGARVQQIEP